MRLGRERLHIMLRQGAMILAVGPCFEGKDEFQAARRALEREGMGLFAAKSQDEAALWLCEAEPAVVLIHLGLTDGSPLAVADFCHYRRPETRVILMGGGGVIADGSLFAHVGNAAAILPAKMLATDLTALIAFHAGARAEMA